MLLGDLDVLNGNDIVVVSGTTGNVQTFLSNGLVDIATRFVAGPPVFFNHSPRALGIADLDADLFPDIFVAGSTLAGDQSPGLVTVRLNSGVTGTNWDGLESKQDFTAGINPVDILFADIDGDNGFDLATANYGSDTVSILENRGSSVGVWLGFEPTANIDVGSAPLIIFARDLDEEKDLDIVTYNQADQSMSILLQANEGAANLGGAFAPSASIPLGGTPLSGTFWDADNDGDPDPAFVMINTEGNRVVRLFRNLAVENSEDNPDATGLSFVFDEDIGEGDGPLLILSGQLNADEGLDLAIIGSNTGGGLLLPEQRTGPDSSNGRVYLSTLSCLSDLNGDGELDFFDISSFLSAFAANDPVADFSNDGEFDFFDISAFLTVFAAGCP